MIFEDADYDDGLEMEQLVWRLAGERDAAISALGMAARQTADCAESLRAARAALRCLADCGCDDHMCAACVTAREAMGGTP